MPNKHLSSGDVGYCEYLRTTRGIIINWSEHTVLSVECEHEFCGYAQHCKLYQHHPVGYTQTFPLSKH